MTRVIVLLSLVACASGFVALPPCVPSGRMSAQPMISALRCKVSSEDAMSRKEFGKLAGMIPLVWASKVLAEAADDEGDADGDAVVQAGRWFNLSGCRRF